MILWIRYSPQSSPLMVTLKLLKLLLSQLFPLEGDKLSLSKKTEKHQNVQVTSCFHFDTTNVIFDR